MGDEPLIDMASLDWSGLAASLEWKVVLRFLAEMEAVIRAKMEDRGRVATLEDLAYFQGRLAVIRALRDAPEFYTHQQRAEAEMNAVEQERLERGRHRDRISS